MACTVTGTFHGALTKDGPPADQAPAVPPPQMVIKTVAITRVDGLQRDTITWSTGTTTDTWLLTDTGMMLSEAMSGSSKFIVELTKDDPTRKFSCPIALQMDADSMAWITPQTFTGKASFHGKPALHYQASMPIGMGLKPTMGLWQAWIDEKTLAPLAFDDSNSLYEVTFDDTPPTERLTLPAQFETDLQKYYNANAKPVHL